MKKKMFSFFIAGILFMSTCFANDPDEPSTATKTEFNRMFGNIDKVQWKKLSGFYEASFIESGIHLKAFFDTDSRVAFVSRNVSINNLPLLVRKHLTDLLDNSWITECFELVDKTGTRYYATIENAETRTLYRTDGNDWSKEKTTRK